MAQDHIVIKLPHDAEPSTGKIDVTKTSTSSKIDDDDGAKISPTSKIDVTKTSTSSKIDDDDGAKISPTSKIDVTKTSTSSKIDDDDGAKISPTSKIDDDDCKIDKIEEVLEEEEGDGNQAALEDSPKVEESHKVESPKDQVGSSPLYSGLRRRIGRIVKPGKLSSQLLGKKGDDGEDDLFMEEGFQDKDKKKKIHFILWILRLVLILIIAVLVTTLTVPFLRRKNLWEINLWKWVLLILFVACGGLISNWIIRVIVCVANKFSCMKKILHLVNQVSKIVEYFVWVGLIFIAWCCLFHKRVKRETNIVFLHHITEILIAFWLGVFVWLLKTLLIRVLASYFYVTTYFDRIRELLFDQFVIETLSGPHLVEIPTTSGRLRSGITIVQLEKINPKLVSAWKMKKLINMVRQETLTTMDEHATQIKSEDDAKVAAQKIFENVARHDDRYVLRFMEEYKGLRTRNLFEGAFDSGKISKHALEKWMVNAFRERRALALTLDNTKAVVNKFNRMLNGLASNIIVFIWLIILKIATIKIVILLVSQIVLFAFVFGNTLKITFEAIIFLFFMHPYDVGDRCEIDQIEMVVEEMNIFTTVFLGSDKRKIILPNNILATKAIHNFRRSPDLEEFIDFFIQVDTPDLNILEIKRRVHNFVEKDKEHWYPSHTILFKGQEELNLLKMTLVLNPRMNSQDMKERDFRRSLVIEELMKILKDLEIISKTV